MAATKKTTRNRATNVEAEVADTAFADMGAWSQAAQDQYETVLNSFNASAEQFRAQAEESFSTARESFEAVGERLRAVNADAVAAAREEMTDAVDFANRLARAKSFGDALEIQRDYWTKLFETRAERARAFADTATEVTREAFAPFAKTPFAMAPGFDKFFPFSAK